jgi:hypothetical protein
MLYKYCSIKGFDILLNKRLKAATFKTFNDPFELCLAFDLNTAIVSLQEEYKHKPDILGFWQKILDGQDIKNDKNSPKDTIDKFAEFQVNDFKKAIDVVRNNWKVEMGIVCLSESYDIIQMWAHYAENHQGIVVGFDKNELVKDKQAIVNVTYDDDMISMPITGMPDKFNEYTEKAILDMMERKETNWGYERETRLYVQLKEKYHDGHYYVKIPSSCVKSIYMGLRSDEMSIFIAKSFKEKEEYKHLKLYKMKKHDTAFKLVADEI